MFRTNEPFDRSSVVWWNFTYERSLEGLDVSKMRAFKLCHAGRCDCGYDFETRKVKASYVQISSDTEALPLADLAPIILFIFKPTHSISESRRETQRST
jgi:hypothetical protein